jgi:hypothetical protein
MKALFCQFNNVLFPTARFGVAVKEEPFPPLRGERGARERGASGKRPRMTILPLPPTWCGAA